MKVTFVNGSASAELQVSNRDFQEVLNAVPYGDYADANHNLKIIYTHTAPLLVATAVKAALGIR